MAGTPSCLRTLPPCQHGKPPSPPYAWPHPFIPFTLAPLPHPLIFNPAFSTTESCSLAPNPATTRTCRCTNQLHEDLDGWHPLLPQDLAAMPAWQATLTALCMATPLKFFASIGRWARTLEGFDLKLHPKQTRFWVWLSWALPLGFIGVVWPALVAAGGVGGLVTYWLGPWLVFHGWLSVMSLVQHTAPHIPWTEEVREFLGCAANHRPTLAACWSKQLQLQPELGQDGMLHSHVHLGDPLILSAVVASCLAQ
jgi:hypothetical protein